MAETTVRRDSLTEVLMLRHRRRRTHTPSLLSPLKTLLQEMEGLQIETPSSSSSFQFFIKYQGKSFALGGWLELVASSAQGLSPHPTPPHPNRVPVHETLIAAHLTCTPPPPVGPGSLKAYTLYSYISGLM